MRLVAENVSKRFRHRIVLRNINFEASSPSSLVITGANGSGKTTLVRIICGLMSPSQGKVSFLEGERTLTPEEIQAQIGLVGPYLQLYRDLSAWENLNFLAAARGKKLDRQRLIDLLTMVGLKGREADPLKAYSSGMLQRIKYVAALYHNPELLILDEPTSNLDDKGKQIVYKIIEEQKRQRIVIIATNESDELNLGDARVDVTC